LASFSIGAAHRLLVHAGLETAALDHEAVDHAVEDRVVVVAGLDVGEEVGGALRCLFGVEFEGDDAVVGGELDHFVFLWGYFFCRQQLDRTRSRPASSVRRDAVRHSRLAPWRSSARLDPCTTLPNTA
jgi:hypothetical protein